MYNTFDSSFFDKDYFEDGIRTGKSWYENYHWMPRRSIAEACAFIDFVGLDRSSYVLDVGCGKGFLVKAFRILEIPADGCDISRYALSFAPEGCWNCEYPRSWEMNSWKGYTHIVIKDVLEHLDKEDLGMMLWHLGQMCPEMVCVVPMGDNGVYRIPEYHTDVSHLIAENETWWINAFKDEKWIVKKSTMYIQGLKDNWFKINPFGNHVFHLFHERKKLF